MKTPSAHRRPENLITATRISSPSSSSASLSSSEQSLGYDQVSGLYCRRAASSNSRTYTYTVCCESHDRYEGRPDLRTNPREFDESQEDTEQYLQAFEHTFSIHLTTAVNHEAANAEKIQHKTNTKKLETRLKNILDTRHNRYIIYSLLHYASTHTHIHTHKEKEKET